MIFNREQNELIKQKESNIRNLSSIFEAIGRLYYSNNSNQPEECYAQMFTNVKNIENELVVLEARINYMNGQIKCSDCGTFNSTGVAFCCKCGKKIPRIVTLSDGSKKCVKCGLNNIPGENFCKDCGTPLYLPDYTEPTPAPQQTPVYQAAQAPQKAPVYQEAQSPQPVQETATFYSTTQDTEPAPTPQPYSEAFQTEKFEMAFCPQCGTKITSNETVFCSNCGNKIR